MGIDTTLQSIGQDITAFFAQPNAFRSFIILILSLILAYWLSNLLARGIIRIAQIVSVRTDNESNDLRAIRLRQVETYLSVTVAAVRVGVILIVGYTVWTLLSPTANSSVAAIGAGTIFVVVAGQTLGMLLRDITAGATMIAEQWFNVGDFVKVEPFMNVSGVVERFTLRSTRLRALNGEVITIHNQQISAVHVVPHGLRTLAVDVFVRDLDAGKSAISKIIAAMPRGKTMLAKPLEITDTEEWGTDRWRITVTGQTAPGREWLIEKFFVEAVIDLDDGKVGTEKLIALPPMPRYADEIADRRFHRAVRIKQSESK